MVGNAPPALRILRRRSSPVPLTPSPSSDAHLVPLARRESRAVQWVLQWTSRKCPLSHRLRNPLSSTGTTRRARHGDGFSKGLQVPRL